MDELVSIIMTAYDEPIDYFNQALESILNQTYKKIEVILVIDNPQNIDIINSAKSFANDHNVTVIINKRNEGLVASLNTALQHVHGSLIARMDSDDIAHPSRITKEVQKLNEGGFDLVATNICNIDSNGNPLGTRTYYPTHSAMIYKYLALGDCMPHPTWLARKTLFDHLDGYRDVDACEDYDFILRGALKGARYALISEPLLSYRLNADSITHRKRSKQKATTIALQKAYRQSIVLSLEKLQNETARFLPQANAYYQGINWVNNTDTIIRGYKWISFLFKDHLFKVELIHKCKRKAILLRDRWQAG